MNKILLSIILFFCSYLISYGAPSVTLDYNVTGAEIQYTLSGTTTGTTCVNMEQYNQWAIQPSTTGTIQYDLENSMANVTSCTAANKCDDINTTTVDLTTDAQSFYIQRNHPWFCLTIDVCTSCTYSITIRGSRL